MSRNQPDWEALARDTIKAIVFQAATRSVHTVGRDGRARVGAVDILGCYAVDDMMAAWTHALDCLVPEIPSPSEQQAMLLLAEGKSWRDWVALVEAGQHQRYAAGPSKDDNQLGLPL